MSFTNVLKKCEGKNILVVGDLISDHYVYGETERISREAPVLIVRHQHEELILGGAANCAHNAKTLGGNVTAIGIIGRDDLGKQMLNAFREKKIAFKGVQSSQARTEAKTRVLAGGINTTRQQMIRIDRGNKPPLAKKDREGLAEAVEKNAVHAQVIVVSDYGAGVACDEVKEVLHHQVSKGKIVCIDSRYNLRDFVGFTVLKPNEPELAAIVESRFDTPKEFVKAGQQALKRLKAEALLVTRGRNGLSLFEATTGKCHELAAVGAPDAVDVTGAGDTVLSAFALSLAAGGSFLDSAEMANWAGSVVVQKAGTATVTPEELREACERYS